MQEAKKTDMNKYYDEGIQYLQEKYHIPLILLTLGKGGSRAYYNGIKIKSDGFAVNAIETTGAGSLDK